MQKDLVILQAVCAFCIEGGNSCPVLSTVTDTHNIAMLITGHHNNGILKPQSSSSNVSDAFCITGDNVSAVQ